MLRMPIGGVKPSEINQIFCILAILLNSYVLSIFPRAFITYVMNTDFKKGESVERGSFNPKVVGSIPHRAFLFHH